LLAAQPDTLKLACGAHNNAPGLKHSTMLAAGPTLNPSLMTCRQRIAPSAVTGGMLGWLIDDAAGDDHSAV
jgi:hypothetical protein